MVSCGPPAGTPRSTWWLSVLVPFATSPVPDAFGCYSCSKTTNELNYLAQKFARAVIGTNNVDSCNRT